jgi:hypothetical protein
MAEAELGRSFSIAGLQYCRRYTLRWAPAGMVVHFSGTRRDFDLVVRCESADNLELPARTIGFPVLLLNFLEKMPIRLTMEGRNS